MPPNLAGARQLQIPRDTPITTFVAWSTLCAGKVYKVHLGANEDAVLRFTGGEPLRYPLHIQGGRNVRVVGLEVALETQPGCAVGQLNNGPLPGGGRAPNIHPRVPGGMALNVAQSGTTFIEGARIDVSGHEADCVVNRSPDGYANASARETRHIVLQNSACMGNEGLGNSPIGNDGVHGDLFQNQGVDILNTLTIENVSHRTAQEGIVLQGNSGFNGAKKLTVRRFDYAVDTRFVADDRFESWGGAIAASADTASFESVYLAPYPGGSTPLVAWQNRYWGPRTVGSVTAMSGLFAGSPPSGAFAPWSSLGRNYTSPHDR